MSLFSAFALLMFGAAIGLLTRIPVRPDDVDSLTRAGVTFALIGALFTVFSAIASRKGRGK